MKISKLAVAVLGALFATSAQAGQYVLQASKWGAAQAAAVAKAGGTVKFSNDKAGMAVVESANPDFLSQVKAGGAVQSGALDRVVQWTHPVVVEDADVVNEANDALYNIQWAPLSVDAPAAWAAGFDGTGARVAVIDGGIFDKHPDLDGNVDVARSASFVVGQAFNSDTGTFWHGTHVAGIIAAKDNTIGVVGIAPRATIIGVKALHAGSGSFGDVMSAIIYSATPIANGGAGAHIINMSLGAKFNRNDEGAAELRSLMNRAVNYATSQGALVVASAGNDAIDFDAAGNLTDTPAESGNAIAISATGPEGWALGATNFSDLASYSNYGNSIIWIAGPGGDARLPGNAPCTRTTTTGSITRPCWVFDLVLSTSRGSLANLNGNYSWAAGTSMSAPAVSAVAALMKQRNPNATPAQLKTGLAKSATDVGKVGQDNLYGRGYVNALRAVTQ